LGSEPDEIPVASMLQMARYIALSRQLVISLCYCS
jgi:hypothetical protein